MNVLYLLVGFIILFLSGEFIVRGGVSLARNFRISTLVVGVTVVSFGTSAPELVVSVKAALTNHPAISIGNVIGSNITNIALVLGLIAVILRVPVKSKSVKVDWPIMMFATVFFYILILDGKLQFLEGLIFVSFLVGFMIWSIHTSRQENIKLGIKFEKQRYPAIVSIMFIIVSAAGLVLGADWLVKGASGIARTLGVSEHAISVSVIALGTSIPEVATSVVAAIRKEMDILVGNIIGSNIFNIFGILGVTSIVKTIPIEESVMKFDIFWLIGISLLLFFFILPFGGGNINRKKGIVFLLIYITYIYLVLLNKGIV
jgi:cation:H+ antiporter